MASKVQDINAQLRYNTTQVLWLCGITQDKLAVFIDSLLTDWLTMYFPDWDEATWKQSRLLLKWWTHNWCLRDERILSIVYAENPVLRLSTYRMEHQMVFNEVTETAKYLQEDFRSLAQDFANEIKAAEAQKATL